jgi:membrane protease YdiL (CAAX protease family)
MPKCQNCGRWTTITDDLICPYCKQPISGTDQEETLKRRRRALENVDLIINMLDQIGLESSVSPREHQTTLKLGILCLVYLIFFIITEIVTFYFSPTFGLVCSFIVLLALIVNSSFILDEDIRKFFIVLGFVPLTRIISLVVPVPEISEIYWYIIWALPIITGIITITRYVNYDIDDIGLNGKHLLVQLPVALSGIGLGIVDYFFLKPESLVYELNVQTVLIPALILIIVTGFMEEVVFRGIIQKAADVLGSWGWVYIAVVYSVLQIGFGSLYHNIFILLVALFFGWIVRATGSIIGVSISHGLFNVGLFLIYPHFGWDINIPTLFSP